MRVPRYYGDSGQFLRDFANFAREHPDFGLHVARAFEQIAEDLVRADRERCDLYRQLEELENSPRY